MLKRDAPIRDVSEIGRGDYVKVGTQWLPVKHNTAEGLKHPRDWTVTTEDGRQHGALTINRYAKAEDLS